MTELAFFCYNFFLLKSPSGGGNGSDEDGGGGIILFIFLLSAPFLTQAETKILVLLSASVKRFFVSRMRDFLIVIIRWISWGWQIIVIAEYLARWNFIFFYSVLKFRQCNIIAPWKSFLSQWPQIWQLCIARHSVLLRKSHMIYVFIWLISWYVLICQEWQPLYSADMQAKLGQYNLSEKQVWQYFFHRIKYLW